MSDPAHGAGLSHTDQPSELAGQLLTAVNRLAFQLRAPATRQGITPSRLAVLAALGRAGPQRLGCLAEQLGVAAASMSRLADVLEEAGLALRTVDAADRRAMQLSLTKHGADVLAELRQEGTEALSMQIESLPPEQAAALRAALPVLESLADGYPNEPVTDTREHET